MAHGQFVNRASRRKQKMSTNDGDFELQKDLTEDKRVLLEKLTTVFGARTAVDFVYPTSFETRYHLTIEDLLNVNNAERDKHFERLRSMEHYQTTRQSLVRLDLEDSYQAFIRGQIARKPGARDELEQFVRNDADVDTVNYYINSPHHPSSNPLQAHLLFHSSKLNEQRANLIKSASSNETQKQLDDGFQLRQYFPDTFQFDSNPSTREKDSAVSERIASQPRSLHLQHGEKKYHVTFLKESQSPRKPPVHSTNHRRHHPPRVTESALDADASCKSDRSVISDVHRESFPPLSLSALEECRPTIKPRTLLTSSIAAQQPGGNFIWEQSIVASKHD